MMRKGLTPIIAMVLLLMLAIAAGGMLFVFATKIQGTMQRQVEEDVVRQTFAQRMSLSIVSVYNGTGTSYPGNIAVLVRNVGAVTIDDITKYVNLLVDGKPVEYKVEKGKTQLEPYDTAILVTTTETFPDKNVIFEIKLDIGGVKEVTKVCRSEDGRCMPP